MSEHLEQIPAEIQSHIREITKSSGLPDTDESVDLIAEGWLEKKERFERITERMRMEEADILEVADERGCLVMTYSGSLLNIGPLREQGRTVQYAAIGLRSDVPRRRRRKAPSSRRTRESGPRFPSPSVRSRAPRPCSRSR